MSLINCEKSNYSLFSLISSNLCPQGRGKDYTNKEDRLQRQSQWKMHFFFFQWNEIVRGKPGQTFSLYCVFNLGLHTH